MKRFLISTLSMILVFVSVVPTFAYESKSGEIPITANIYAAVEPTISFEIPESITATNKDIAADPTKLTYGDITITNKAKAIKLSEVSVTTVGDFKLVSDSAFNSSDSPEANSFSMVASIKSDNSIAPKDLAEGKFEPNAEIKSKNEGGSLTLSFTGHHAASGSVLQKGATVTLTFTYDENDASTETSGTGE